MSGKPKNPYTLPWDCPTLNLNYGKISAACAGQLPKLVERTDLHADLHSKASDGHHSLREMAAVLWGCES